MPTLTIHFRRDFDGQGAVVRINGRRRWASTALTTRLLLDVAEVVRLRVPIGPVTVHVTMTPGGEVSRQLEIDDNRDLEVWYLDGALELREPPATPAYL
jgi:hypothetical protein